ncbi:MAG: aminotransferase class V-fold PLP-dependent enzyme [Ilumatobacteraceae bacterium]|jgi:glutamate/tyrosine decarboxylase-like PLP-dependent enzyme|nr:aminotransferase class V-fold PLP-dependent enzyme [Ilumatobacteraceae bacterium]
MAPPTSPLHGVDPATEQIATQIFDYVLQRIRMSPPPLDGPRPAAELRAATGPMITDEGLGYERAFGLFRDVLAPACISSDHPRYLAFVPTAPAEAATLFDLVVSASSIYGDWWLEGAGAIYAENETLRWLASLAGFPDTAGGVFVSGGTAGNLAALTTARETWRREHGRDRPIAIAAAPSAHSSIRLAAMVIDVPIVTVAPDPRGRLTGTALRATIEAAHADGLDVMAIVATAGATNTGIVDDLAGAAEAATEYGAWLHVDGAYGCAALASTIGRPLFRGIEAADSFVLDPHKWLFAPFDCCALVYRDPGLAGAALTQHAEYLETLDATAEWNPSDFAIHMTRRVRGLPLWFSVTAHGARAYDVAVSRGIELAQLAARAIEASDHLELVMEPELSVVLFRRRGWDAERCQAWSDEALADGLALVVPTVHDGETMFRLCFVNPTTTSSDIDAVLAAMR